jgi:hypothetical protein
MHMIMREGPRVLLLVAGKPCEVAAPAGAVIKRVFLGTGVARPARQGSTGVPATTSRVRTTMLHRRAHKWPPGLLALPRCTCACQPGCTPVLSSRHRSLPQHQQTPSHHPLFDPTNIQTPRNPSKPLPPPPEGGQQQHLLPRRPPQLGRLVPGRPRRGRLLALRAAPGALPQAAPRAAQEVRDPWAVCCKLQPAAANSKVMASLLSGWGFDVRSCPNLYPCRCVGARAAGEPGQRLHVIIRPLATASKSQPPKDICEWQRRAVARGGRGRARLERKQPPGRVHAV